MSNKEVIFAGFQGDFHYNLLYIYKLQ